MKNRIPIVLPAVIALGLVAPSTWAQSAPPNTPASDTRAAGASHAQKREAYVEQRIKDLHDRLKITAQQTTQWETYAQTMRANARRIDQAFQERAGRLPSMNADEVMKSYAELTQLHADNMQRLARAFDTLYKSLSAEQKSTADEMFRNIAEKRRGATRKPEPAAPGGESRMPEPAK